jgi:hypothetical protein
VLALLTIICSQQGCVNLVCSLCCCVTVLVSQAPRVAARMQRIMETMIIKSKPFGQLVLLSCGITTSIPEAYQRSHLLRSLGLFQRDASSWSRFRASDAFSAYPFRTWLLCYAIGMTTDAPSVRSFRSSRTKNETPQASNARIG